MPHAVVTRDPPDMEFFLIPDRINECGSQTVMFHLPLESVLPEFDQYLAIYTFVTMKQEF
jgi:hypothetical protein